MNVFSSLSPSLIGLDIEPHALKLVQLRKTRRGFMADCIAYQPLPDDIFAECKIKNWSRLSMILAQVVEDFDLKGGVTAIHLPAHLVRMQRIRFTSGMRDAAIEAEIYTHVQKELPGISEALCIDYTEIAKNNGYADVFFAAAKQAYLSQYIDCINAAGLKTKIVDVDIYALKRSICFSSVNSQPITQIAVHITGDVANLMAFHAEDFFFHQYWEVGMGQELMVQLRNHLQVCLATVGKVGQLAICVGKPYRYLFAEEYFVEECLIYHPNPFNKLQLASTIDQTWLIEHAQELFIALGLAMREVPRW